MDGEIQMRFEESSRVGDFGEEYGEFVIEAILKKNLIEQLENDEPLSVWTVKSAIHSPKGTKRQKIDRVDWDFELQNVNTKRIVKYAIDVKTDKKAYKTGNIYVEDPAIHKGCANMLLYAITNFPWKDDFTISDEENITTDFILVEKWRVKELIERANPQYWHCEREYDDQGEMTRESGYPVPINHVLRLDKVTETTVVNNISFQPGSLWEVTHYSYCP